MQQLVTVLFCISWVSWVSFTLLRLRFYLWSVECELLNMILSIRRKCFTPGWKRVTGPVSAAVTVIASTPFVTIHACVSVAVKKDRMSSQLPFEDEKPVSTSNFLSWRLQCICNLNYSCGLWYYSRHSLSSPLFQYNRKTTDVFTLQSNKQFSSWSDNLISCFTSRRYFSMKRQRTVKLITSQRSRRCAACFLQPFV